MGLVFLSFPLIHKVVSFIHLLFHTVFFPFVDYFPPGLEENITPLTIIKQNHTLFHMYYYL